ncbi:unnamed protein product [Dicrocoelium dendriticum]|nr:unnamed protein product [Dicrocoelium dendriticum]
MQYNFNPTHSHLVNDRNTDSDRILSPALCIFHGAKSTHGQLNVTHQVGCSSRSGGNAGVVLFVTDASSLLAFLTMDNAPETALVMEYELFTNATLMAEIRSHPSLVAGIVVFSPAVRENHTILPFSESSTCPNSLYGYYGPGKQCNVTPPWNVYGVEYSAFHWPFPVVLVHDPHGEIKTEIASCFRKFNMNPKDDTRCSIEISNYMSAVQSVVTCTRRQKLMASLISETNPTYCDELTGINIVLSATNTSVARNVSGVGDGIGRAANSSLLILTRMDSRSMFERSGFASQGALPAIAVLVSTAVHLMRQPSIKNLEVNKDLFFAFLDNEAYDFLGSTRLDYDLQKQLLANYMGIALGWEHLHSIIELGEIGLPSKDSTWMYSLLTENEIYQSTRSITDYLMDQLQNASRDMGQITFTRPEFPSYTLLPPTVSVQNLLARAPRPIPHVVLFDHVGSPLRDPNFESFLDVRWPPVGAPDADDALLGVANTLSDAIHRIITVDAKPVPARISSPTPGELMDCFVNNPNCSLFRPFLTPSDIQFLVDLGTPIPGQSYLPLNKHELKISHIVNVLLMGLTGERTATTDCPPQKVDDPYVYFMGYYNGSEQCYRTLLDLASRFVLSSGGIPTAPGWMKSRTVSGARYVRWYRSASPIIDGFGIALGVILSILTGSCAFLLRNAMRMESGRQAQSENVDVVNDHLREHISVTA